MVMSDRQGNNIKHKMLDTKTAFIILVFGI